MFRLRQAHGRLNTVILGSAKKSLREGRSARSLYRLIVRVLAEEGIFNVRKHGYFGVGWKEGLEDSVKEDLEDLQSQEVEDENSGK